MTIATPQAQSPNQTNAQPRPEKALTPEKRLESILTNDIQTDGKQKPPATQKSVPAKPRTAAQAKPKEAPQGQTEGDDGVDDTATGDTDDQDPLADGHTADKGDDAEADILDGDPDDTEADDLHEGDDDGMLYKVKVAGKELEVPLSELLKGYSRTADYQQKTAAVAKERKEVEAIKESVKDLPQQRETYVKQAEWFTTAATALKVALQAKFMPQPPNPELAKTDPAAFWAAKEAHENAGKFLGAIEQQLTVNQQRAVDDAKATHQRAVQESRKKLYEAMPDMQQTPARQKLREYANSLGFSDNQIQNETNHVLFVCVEKARRWDELQVRKANVKPKAPIQKVVRRTNAPETARAGKQREKQNVLTTHKQQKSIKSAEAALMAHFSDG